MRLMVSGGGTGGHIYPALAVINELKRQDPNAEVMYVGSQRGIESTIVPELGIPFKEMEIQGFKRSLSLENFKTVYLFLKSVHRAKKLVREFKPDVVLGTGGYVSGAVLYAAAKQHVPTVIHEQNSVVGMTNKFLSRYVDKIAINFEMARDQFPADKVVMTGNPRAQEVANIDSHFDLASFGLDNTKPTLLVVGGSQGALKINKVMVESLKTFATKDYQVVFVTGPKRYDDVMAQIKDLKAPNIAIKAYISNMPEVLPKMAAVVGRSGATTLAELTALGVPSILIPSPYVTADHQTKNAQSLVDANAALMITEADLSPETLVSTVNQLMTDPSKQAAMAAASKKLGKPQAATEMVALLRSVITAHQ
ncbi:UDP-N-acetylglucosamine--N-acetylmuramyl-(pentapeptide) pyrophosphoryl-undecaprenol N-acetylglucosamine transferase [Secundilactobacillus paracollinoides]|uniref:UDP-N-acetylglucosamine--N-acetylmuramyl-(pentapeptide) pyrophosphoryl-undecaprenol N-acetylglucosamine transferase n=1 Tax=Secundilactobacillus paracollinoides TaxID=240427 RepID=A0A1B2J0A4_9LACO|nr:undecaprenyldiphospho-muramoylpentapeptide beta-N-acetylglucosaminyltransferase [Secundilactobacillus paracollinoides]ANZ61759.1 UDP-N-acetylglucosamine--N-acetylmuramyl-(pentapeptide) pyrophosphoryl-undecaprenol N-acetylglucosamine transferase [Secundilactobacillus paracollinoides]ANZ63394.1 UDP-N-acetylglucosamine--N-acetylmuramyl-(pentapeptide) pyrophosphoryl-undecaprenol N-acetylglucosamine transferase [Secundilactobacillus paracollinoides]ANZ67678.1 UDP-N-acetylglucosamine--N-acetylmuram